VLLRCFSTIVLAMLRHFGATQFRCSSVIRVAVARLVGAIPQRFTSRQGPAHLLPLSAIPCDAHPKRVSASARISFPVQLSTRLVSAVPRLIFAKRFLSTSPRVLRRAYQCCSFLLRVASQLLDAYAAHRLSTPSRRRSSAAPSPFVSMPLLLYALAFSRRAFLRLCTSFGR